MKDKKIINIISKTYAAIVTLLSFIILSLVIIFIVLQHGLYIDELSISNITIKKTYIKWNDRLNISIEAVNIQKSTKSDNKFVFEDINKYTKELASFFLLTESLLIEKLQYGELEASLKYSTDKEGTIVVKAPDFHLNSHFEFLHNRLLFSINRLNTLQNKINIHGNILVDNTHKLLYAKLQMQVDNNADLTLYLRANNKRLQYAITSQKDIKHLRAFVALFHLPKEIRFWTMDAIDAPSLTLKKARGFLQYNDLENAYRHLHIVAILNKLNYTYNPKLDAVHTQKTELEFLNGVLYIRPKEAYSYGMNLGKSWLKIDFTRPQEILTLHLLFNGKLNKDMLHILSIYHIKLPFLQHSGSVETDLALVVNLRTIAIDAHGTFFTKEANFDYLGLNIDINNTLIKLDNYDVTIPQMQAHYKNIADANVTVKFNAKESIGVINFKANKIKINNSIYLNTNKKALDVQYKISPNGDTITTEKSQWIINGMQTTIDGIQMPFNLHTLSLNVPTSYFSIKDVADGFVTGIINLKKLQMDFKLDLLHFTYSGVKLAQSNVELALHYDKVLNVTAKDDIFMSVNGSKYTISKLLCKVNNNNVLLEHTQLKISKFINTEINANFNMNTKEADIALKHFILLNPKSKKILYYRNNIKLKLFATTKSLKVISKELQAKFLLKNDRWILNLNSIGTVAKNSNFLKKYNITNGKASFYKRNSDKYTKFKGAIYYKYKLLTNKNKVVKKYKIKGYISKEQNVYFSVNDKVNIKVSNNIKINLKKIGMNVEDMVPFIKMLMQKTAKPKKGEKPINIFLEAQDSYLYVGNNRYIIFDALSLQYYKGIVTAQLSHKKGKARFRLQDDTFYLYGSDFDSLFMEKLFSFSKFSGGSLDFSMNGKLDDYSGIFYINNTTIHDYVVLNNILAFINTVPSLATFSLPGYNKNGLHIDKAYMKFHSKNHIFHISDIYIGSKEVKILGKGTASIKYDTVDLNLNLQTDLASDVSKIPLVGYIIFDGKSISTSLKVTGKLTDPKVTTTIAKDIAVAPLNIILRTLTLPYKLFKSLSDINTSSEPKK